MEKRVQTFLEESLLELEESVNDWLEVTPGRLHEVVPMPLDIADGYYGILVVYTPEDRKYEKERKENEKSDEGVQRRTTPLRQPQWTDSPFTKTGCGNWFSGSKN